MTTTTANKAPFVVVPTIERAALAAPTRGVLDVRTSHGGIATIKIQNGATGPGVPCACNVLIAHASGDTPAAGSAGAVWKATWSFTGVTSADGVVEIPFTLDKDAMHYCFEFVGNTIQPVTVEVLASVTASYTSV